MKKLIFICIILVNTHIIYAQDKGDYFIKQEMVLPEKLNPVTTNDAAATEIDEIIFESLLSIDKKTFELRPQLAVKFPQISEDHLTYTFELNKNIKFSDGTPLTGEDIIFTLKVIKNPFVDAQALRNYFAYTQKAELVDGDKFKIKFTQSKPYFRAIYSIGDMRIIAKHIFDAKNISDKFSWEDIDGASESLDGRKYPEMQKFADFFNSRDASTSPEYLIGSGPYFLVKWDEQNETITLKRNDNYWKKDSPHYLDKIIIKAVGDYNLAIQEIKNNKLDFMFVIQPYDFFEGMKNPEQYNLKKVLVPEPVYAYIAWNNENPLFKDKKVRRALSYAVDRQTIIDKILYGAAVPIQSHIYYKSKFINDNLPLITYDLEKAKQLLAEAGWKDTDGDGVLDKIVDGRKTDFKFTFMNNNNPKRKKIMLPVIESLKQIGISADLKEYEWSVFLDKCRKRDFDACYAAWQLNVTADDPFMIWHSSQAQDEGSNFISYNNSESDKLLEENRITFDDGKRKEILDKWQQIIYDDQPVTFLWTEQSRYFYSDRFRNIEFYGYPGSAYYSEWWVPKELQKYK